MPLIMDVMNANAWGSAELLDEILPEVEHKPDMLSNMSLFDPVYSRSSTVAVVIKGNTLNLIPTSAKGEAPAELVPEGAKLRYFGPVRLAKGSTVYASEMADVMLLPEQEQVAEVVSELQDRYQQINDDMELTREHMFLGAVQGVVYDADGTTVLYDWYDEFGVSKPTEVNFALGTQGTNVKKKCRNIKREIQKEAKGVWTSGAYVAALAGDAFFDDLVAHPSLKETKLNTERAKQLENIEGYSAVEIEGILFINYRGTDDGSKLAIDTNQAKFFPVGARGAFKIGWCPCDEFKEFIGKKGQPLYPVVFDDKDRGAWDRVELYSYPLPICTRPLMLRSARRA